MSRHDDLKEVNDDEKSAIPEETIIHPHDRQDDEGPASALHPINNNNRGDDGDYSNPMTKIDRHSSSTPTSPSTQPPPTHPAASKHRNIVNISFSFLFSYFIKYTK